MRVIIGFGIVLPAVVVLVFAGCVPSYRRAQSVSASAPDSSLQRVVSRIALEPNTVRLARRGTGRAEGYGLRVFGDSVSLHSDGRVRTIAVVDVDSLWVQRGTAALTVGILAAIPCAVFGALIGEFIATDPDSNGRPGRGPYGALIGAVLFGAPCGGLGAAIGSLFHRWRLEYARNSPLA